MKILKRRAGIKTTRQAETKVEAEPEEETPATEAVTEEINDSSYSRSSQSQETEEKTSDDDDDEADTAKA